MTQFAETHIFFQTKVDVENDGNLHSASSNPTIVKSYAALLAGGWLADITRQ